MHPAQLVIIDEASLAGTLDLDTLTQHAVVAGAKILLTGDWAQLSGIDAGGALALLAHDRPDTPTLTAVHRFSNTWERHASIRLRLGDPTAIDTYLRHDRVHDADDRDHLLDELYDAWRTDAQSGLASLMITGDRDTANQLNARPQADHLQRLPADAPTAVIADGNIAAVGDRITTRRNDRTLRTGDSWVKNGDTWTVTAVRSNGDLVARRNGTTTSVTLAAGYVRTHVELGYATTTYRAQGRTVDTAHALIDTRATREDLYVSATRARHDNRIYTDRDHDTDVDTTHDNQSRSAASEVLQQVVAHTRSSTSAHNARRIETDRIHHLQAATLDWPSPAAITSINGANTTHGYEQPRPYAGPEPL